MEEIELHPHLFNPLYWHITEALNNEDIRHIYVYGGSSSAKTYTFAQSLLIDGELNEYNSIVFRKESATIRDTIFNDFKEIDSKLQLNHEFQEHLIKLPNNQIRFRGVDKSGKVKGLKGFKKVLLDELDHFKYEDYKEFKRRLRGSKGQQMLYTWNPISQDHWIKTEIIDKDEWVEAPLHIENCPSEYSKLHDKSGKWINKRGDSILIRTNHPDNYWVVGHPNPNFGMVDKHALTEFDIMQKLTPNDYEIYAWGNWGTIQVQSPYITAFEEIKHVSDKAIFDKSKQFVMSFDFNIGNTACTFYHYGSNYIHVFDEIVAEDLPQMLEKIKMKYNGHLHKCEVTGDRSGNNRTHMIGDAMNSYRLIKNTLGLTPRQFKVIVNPTHKENRSTCNFLLSLHPEFIINPNCTRLIYDLKYVECDDNQQIIKKDRNVANQKADFLDSFRYFLNVYKRKWIKEYNPKL